MTTTTERKTIALEFRWTTSRARDSYGYNVCTLYADGVKVARCDGGGYDMKGTCLGSYIASHFADRLCALKSEDMPEQSHWERSENPRKVCRNTACLVDRLDKPEPDMYFPPEAENCPHCGEELETDYNDGKRIDDGRYFYGLTFHDPNYDPSKAVIGKDCSDRTLSNESSEGKTVGQAEAEGVSFGLERYQAIYKASSHHATERHTIPSIDGGCGMSSVQRIMEAIGLNLEYVPGRRNRKDEPYILHDAR